jgi:hypothetical protein
MSVPCTWSMNTARTVICSCKRIRLRCTSSGSSPTCRPRLRLAYRADELPPLRVLQQACTAAGAGQSGTIQSMFSACIGQA